MLEKMMGSIDINKFCSKLVEINIEEDSKKIINKNPKK